MSENTKVHVETMRAASRCREFNSRGRQCGNYTTKTLVISYPGTDRPAYRTPDCGRHK